MPFVFDLHLFLGRPVQFAAPEHTKGRLLRMSALMLDTFGGDSAVDFFAVAMVPTLILSPLPPQTQMACLVGSLRVFWMTKALISLRLTKTLWTFKIYTGFLKMPTSSTSSRARIPPPSPSDGSKARIHPPWLSIHSSVSCGFSRKPLEGHTEQQLIIT